MHLQVGIAPTTPPVPPYTFEDERIPRPFKDGDTPRHDAEPSVYVVDHDICVHGGHTFRRSAAAEPSPQPGPAVERSALESS